MAVVVVMVVAITVLVLIYFIHTSSLVALLMIDIHSLITALECGYHHYLHFVYGAQNLERCNAGVKVAEP